MKINLSFRLNEAINRAHTQIRQELNHLALQAVHSGQEALCPAPFPTSTLLRDAWALDVKRVHCEQWLEPANFPCSAPTLHSKLIPNIASSFSPGKLTSQRPGHALWATQPIVHFSPEFLHFLTPALITHSELNSFPAEVKLSHMAQEMCPSIPL